MAIFAGFFSQNTMVASTFGLYGIYIGYFAEEFSASRTVASTGLPIVLLTMGLVNPFMGVLLGRFSLARILQTGALLLGFGFFLASVSASVVGVLACFIIIGVGAACMGPVPCTALAASWFEESRGRAIGFVNLPVGAVLMPPLATWLFQVIGWRVSFALLAALLLALIPLFGCVSTGPYQEPPRSSGPGAKSLFASSPMIKTVGFWVLIVSVGLVLASGSTRLVHIVE
ncbi:MAG: MFS transporter, partial [Halioglobus sp.]|nr:MFS transporter [Halioglobus sp.]